jgi:predicted dithiol-disulfide oxidoreductase (DUF899 family)
MCPACIAASTLAASASAAGGLAAFAVSLVPRIGIAAGKAEGMRVRTHPEHVVVSRAEWLVARKELLVREKELTQQRDVVSRRRRELPWVKVEKKYAFEGPDGRKSLSDLFAGRSQLIINHFMLAPGWQEGCDGCSFLADHIDGVLPHLEHHDVSLVVVSRAPLAEIQRFKSRMGWRFQWVSSFGSDFNLDYHVSFIMENMASGVVFHNYRRRESQTEGEAPGLSVFYKNAAGEVFHTYSTYARGGDLLLGRTTISISPRRGGMRRARWIG